MPNFHDALNFILTQGASLSGEVSRDSERLIDSRDELRKQLIEQDIVWTAPVFSGAPSHSVSGVDGGCVNIEKMFTDFCMVVALEIALGKQNELVKFNDNVSIDSTEDCNIWMDMIPRSSESSDVIRGLMALMEFEVASRSSSDVVMMDGSFSSLLVNINKACRSLFELSDSDNNKLARALDSKLDARFSESVLRVLDGKRFCAFPKYNTVNHFSKLRIPDVFLSFDSRMIATFALEPGEMTTSRFFAHEQKDMFTSSLLRKNLGEEFSEKIRNSIEHVKTTYYRPHHWTAAYRIDISSNCDDDDIEAILHSVYDATTQPDILEPTPLYFADILAKNLCETFSSVGENIPFEDAMQQDILDKLPALYFQMNYRTSGNI